MPGPRRGAVSAVCATTTEEKSRHIDELFSNLIGGFEAREGRAQGGGNCRGIARLGRP
jgi:hypothetical protein